MARITATRDDVLRAIASYDDLGAAEFHATSGYKPSTVYQVRHAGRSYPSKAILGVAAGLRPSEFFGGVAQTVPALLRLGFVVLRNGRRVTDVGLEKLARDADLDGRRPYLPDMPVEPAAVFASGSNRPGEIRGFGAAGVDVGVAAGELNETALAELEALEGSDVQVFVDSGAFGEVAVRSGNLEVVRPMTDGDWSRVLSIYERLGAVLGDQLWIVAPDRVGSQRETLLRLERYRDDVTRLHAAGVRVLVPLQNGAMSLADFAAAVDRALGFTDWIPALPCKKAATLPGELARFVAARRPAHVHLLGLGPRNRYRDEYLAPFASDDGPSVSLDANWITANVGRGGRIPRAYTRGRDLAKHLLGAAACPSRVAELAVLVALAPIV